MSPVDLGLKRYKEMRKFWATYFDAYMFSQLKEGCLFLEKADLANWLPIAQILLD